MRRERVILWTVFTLWLCAVIGYGVALAVVPTSDQTPATHNCSRS